MASVVGFGRTSCMAAAVAEVTVNRSFSPPRPNKISRSLGSTRSGAPNALVARWCVSPSFPRPGSPQSRTPHEQCTYAPVFDRPSATNTSPSAFVCLSLGSCSSTCHFQPSTPDHFNSRRRKIPASFASISSAIDEHSYIAGTPHSLQPFKTHSLRPSTAA